MKCRVEWSDEAQNDLASIWLAAADRGDVTARVADAETLLKTGAREASEEVAEGLRRLDVPPLFVYFVLDESTKLVEVYCAKWSGM